MKSNTKIILVSTVLIGLMSGCSLNKSSVSGGTPGLSPMTSCVKYEIIGDAMGEDSGAVLFGFIDLDEDDKVGQVAGEGWPGSSFIDDPSRDTAIYNAIESVPGADAIMAPRFTRTRNGIFGIYITETVSVKGKAIRYAPTVCK